MPEFIIEPQSLSFSDLQSIGPGCEGQYMGMKMPSLWAISSIFGSNKEVYSVVVS